MRILIVETLYLGDLIHTLPLVQAVRARYPNATLDVLVRAAHVGLMRHVQGVDGVLSMDPKIHRGVLGMRQLCATLRAARYDLALNPGASDRATMLTAWSGSRRRIGRLNRRQSRWLWPLLHDEVIDQHWGAEPMYWQKLCAFSALLQLPPAVAYGLDLSSVSLAGVSLPRRYLHLSPFASEQIRSLPPATVVELLVRLREALPHCDVVVTCGPADSDRRRLAAIAPSLRSLGAILLDGNLDLPQLGAVIQRAALHIGPDSGPLHLAAALGTRTAACFLYKDASAEWMPVGVLHRSFGVTTRLEGGLYGLPLGDVVAYASEVVGHADESAVR